MKTKIYKFESTTVDLTQEELQNIIGGGFAYDFAFALREFVKYVANGGGTPGLAAVGADLGVNYKPLN